ncbi:DUF115 domain-containing protein [Candidatus Thorarchaeota archaeon]|nr:MAG: DUF115 domain-containing protein [Candidatus Thorarchaeota archaeon]
MKWSEWQPLYNGIVSELGLNPEEDRRATQILSSILIGRNSSLLLQELRVLIRERIVVVCGAGPSLKNHLERIERQELTERLTFIAADGATSALLEEGIQVDIIVTDLDGDLGDIKNAIKQGAIPIVHAHGDNMHIVEDFLPSLKTVIGSTQVEPQPNVFLWGGFTDGDRGCYLATHYKPAKLVLAGMDFGHVVGKWSKPEYIDHIRAPEKKRKKLEIAQRLLGHLWETTDVKYEIMR